MTTITKDMLTEAAYVSVNLLGSSQKFERDMGELLRLALLVDRFSYSYSSEAIVRAQTAIIYAYLGAEKLMSRALRELSALRGYGRLYEV